jgi:protein gp37
MGENSKIEWTDHTFNPWTGCTKISPACANCYAEAWAKRSGIVKWGDAAARRKTAKANWRKPIEWNRDAALEGVRKRVFCASLADVFEDRPEVVEWRKELFELIAKTPNLDWLLLTKRPHNIKRLSAGMPPTVWLGTTIENSDYLDRANDLIECREQASVLFLSCEPLLNQIDLKANQRYQREQGFGYRPIIDDLDWVIGGFESGPGHRKGNESHAIDLRDQCISSGVAFFWKQNGGITSKAGGCLLDGVEYKQFPKAA